MKYVAGIEPPKKDKAITGMIFQEALNARYKGEDTKEIIAKMEPKSRGVATLLLSKAYDFNDIVSLDEPYDIDIGFGVPLRFVPDILTKDSIIENKFTTGYYNPKMVLSERQRIVYYLGVRKLFGIDPKVYYQLFNTSKKTVELINTPTSPLDIRDLIKWIELKLDQINHCMATGVWDIGTHSYCDYNKTCPLIIKYGPMPKKSGGKK